MVCSIPTESVSSTDATPMRFDPHDVSLSADLAAVRSIYSRLITVSEDILGHFVSDIKYQVLR